MTDRQHFFSYGLFKEGQGLHKWLSEHSEPTLVGPAVAKNCVLFDVGGFPGLKRGQGTVNGQLWLLPWVTIETIFERLEKSKRYTFHAGTVDVMVGKHTFPHGAITFVFEDFKAGPRAVRM